MSVEIGKNVKIGKDVHVEAPIRIGFTCGAFDLLHTGHALMLKEAKAQCDYLIVGVQTDPTLDRPEKNKPVQGYEERLTMVESIKYVDEIRTYATESQLINLLKKIMPDVRIVGADWEGREFTGHELDIEIYYNSRAHSYSSSSLRQRIYNAELSKRAVK